MSTEITFIINAPGVDEPAVVLFEGESNSPDFDIAKNFEGLIRFTVSYGNLVMVSPMNALDKLFNQNEAESLPDARKELMINMITEAMYKNGFRHATKLEAPAPTDPRLINTTFGTFSVKSTKSDNDIEYSIKQDGQPVFNLVIGTVEHANATFGAVSELIKSFECIRENITTNSTLWPTTVAHHDHEHAAPVAEAVTVPEAPAKPVEDEAPVNAILAERVSQGGQLNSLLGSLYAEPAKPQVAQVKEESVNPNVVSRAALLIARKGEAAQMELIFTGNDITALEDQNFVGYLTNIIADKGSVLYVNSDKRNLVLLDEKLAKNYLLVINAAVADMKLDVTFVRQEIEVGPRRTDTIYL